MNFTARIVTCAAALARLLASYGVRAQVEDVGLATIPRPTAGPGSSVRSHS